MVPPTNVADVNAPLELDLAVCRSIRVATLTRVLGRRARVRAASRSALGAALAAHPFEWGVPFTEVARAFTVAFVASHKRRGSLTVTVACAKRASLVRVTCAVRWAITLVRFAVGPDTRLQSFQPSMEIEPDLRACTRSSP